MSTFEASSAQRHLPAHAILQDGKYRIIKVIGQGGFGITYLAEHKNFGEVALKELFLSSGTAHCSRENTTQRQVIAHFDRFQFDDFKKRFLEEARTLYKLRDVKGVVKVIDIFEENGTVYFSMEYLEGDKLEDYVKKRTRLSENEGKEIIESVGRTLADIHKRNVLHRDVKPANIIVSPTGETTLIDFGIARSYAEDEANTHTTFHSPRYSPPEQKIAKSRMGVYSDVYSLGATAYFVFTGQPPQSLEERITEDYISPQTLVPGLSNTVNRAITNSLTIRDKERTQTIDAFLHALGKPFYPKEDKPSLERPPQYSPPSDEVTKIFSTPPPQQRQIQSDDATRIEPLQPQKPAKEPVPDDATMLFVTPPPVKKEPENTKPPIVEDDKTMLEVKPQQIVEDDKTMLEVLPSMDNTPDIDTEKTLILGQNITPQQAQNSASKSWKDRLKTREGRIIGTSVILSILLILGTLLSPLVCGPKIKDARPNIAPLPPKDTTITMTVDTISKTIVPVSAPVDTSKAVKKAEPVKKPVPKGKTTAPTTTTYIPAPRPTIEEVPVALPNKVESTTPIKAPELNIRPYIGKFGLVTLENNMTCTVKGEAGTYRVGGSKGDWIELVCLMQSGKEHHLFYYKSTQILKFENKDLKR